MAHETDKAKALAAGVDVLKVTLTLATGTLVFSAGLLTEKVKVGTASKYLLVFSWCSLGISILAGALAYMRVPVMIAEGKCDIEDGWFKRPGQVHNVAFLLGVIALGIAMIMILSAE